MFYKLHEVNPLALYSSVSRLIAAVVFMYAMRRRHSETLMKERTDGRITQKDCARVGLSS